MVDVTTSIEIDEPVHEVATYAADPANAPSWYVNIESVRWETEPVVAIGSKATFVARFLGRTLEYTYEIVEHEAGKQLVMRTSEGPFPMETSYTWEPHAGGTRMTLRNRGEPAGFSKFLSPFLSMAMKRANQKDVRALATLLQERGSPT